MWVVFESTKSPKAVAVPISEIKNSSPLDQTSLYAFNLPWSFKITPDRKRGMTDTRALKINHFSIREDMKEGYSHLSWLGNSFFKRGRGDSYFAMSRVLHSDDGSMDFRWSLTRTADSRF